MIVNRVGQMFSKSIVSQELYTILLNDYLASKAFYFQLFRIGCELMSLLSLHHNILDQSPDENKINE